MPKTYFWNAWFFLKCNVHLWKGKLLFFNTWTFYCTVLYFFKIHIYLYLNIFEMSWTVFLKAIVIFINYTNKNLHHIFQILGFYFFELDISLEYTMYLEMFEKYEKNKRNEWKDKENRTNLEHSRSLRCKKILRRQWHNLEHSSPVTAQDGRDEHKVAPRRGSRCRRRRCLPGASWWNGAGVVRKERRRRRWATLPPPAHNLFKY